MLWKISLQLSRTVLLFVVFGGLYALVLSTADTSADGSSSLGPKTAIQLGAIPSTWELLLTPPHCSNDPGTSTEAGSPQLMPDGSYDCIRHDPTFPSPLSASPTEPHTSTRGNDHNLLQQKLQPILYTLPSTTSSTPTTSTSDTTPTAQSMPSSPLPPAPTGVVSTAVNTTAIPTAPTVTAVLMNWHRPNNTQTILDAYTQMSSISEIILLMLRPATAFEYSHPKVRTLHNYSLNADHGLSLRFLGCLYARSDFVLIQDDDVMLDDEGVAAMLAAKVGHPGRLVGCCGRDWSASRPSYIPLHVDPGPARIVLTIAMLTHRGACADFWGQRLLMEDVAALGTPRWNGEDIFFSLVTFKSSGELPEVVGFNYTQVSRKASFVSRPLLCDNVRAWRGVVLTPLSSKPAQQV